MTTTQIPVYPGIFQAIILVVLLVILFIVFGFGVVFASIAAGFEGSLGDPELVGLVGLGNLLSFAVVLAWAVKRTKLPLSLALPFPAVRPMVYLPLIVMLVGLGIVLSEVITLSGPSCRCPGFSPTCSRTSHPGAWPRYSPSS